MLASNYPLLDVFISTLYLALFLFWLILAFHVLGDVFRSRDLGAGAKTRWILLILILPVLGCLLYVLIRGGTMHHDGDHTIDESRPSPDSRKALEDYIRDVANTKE